MKIVTKKVEIEISREEKLKLLDLSNKINETFVCDLIHCCDCAEICNEKDCPFYSLDNELREVYNKILTVADKYGPKCAD